MNGITKWRYSTHTHTIHIALYVVAGSICALHLARPGNGQRQSGINDSRILCVCKPRKSRYNSSLKHRDNEHWLFWEGILGGSACAPPRNGCATAAPVRSINRTDPHALGSTCLLICVFVLFIYFWPGGSLCQHFATGKHMKSAFQKGCLAQWERILACFLNCAPLRSRFLDFGH